jgi:hypothetical protein
MIGPENGAVPTVTNSGDEQTIKLDGGITLKRTRHVNTVASCVMACSRPAGACQFRCPVIEVGQ